MWKRRSGSPASDGCKVSVEAQVEEALDELVSDSFLAVSLYILLVFGERV